MRRTLLAITAALSALGAGVLVPAQAITNGAPDDGAHPYVGLMAAYDDGGAFLWTCSGSFLDEDTFLTAGHCTELPAVTVKIWLGDGPLNPRLPMAGEGTPLTHPEYDPNDFTAHDLGVVELAQPVQGLDEFAELPGLDELDALTPSVQTTFTAVGYGLTRSSTPQADRYQDPKTRMVAHPRLLKINHRETGDGSFVVSANAKTGGTCAGDSGGPVLLEDSDVVAGVVSYGKNPLCGGQSGVYRVDRADDLDWLAEFAS